MFASCGRQQPTYQALENGTTYQTLELGTPPSPMKTQNHSVPVPICFVFKSSESKGGKPQKNKAKGATDKTSKARAEKAKAKSDPKKEKSYVFEKDPNKTDVENFIDSIENFECLGLCNNDTSVETMIFKSIDFSKMVNFYLYLFPTNPSPPSPCHTQTYLALSLPFSFNYLTSPNLKFIALLPI